jgi:hypothetical protein
MTSKLSLTFWSQNSKSGVKKWSHFFSDLGPFFGNLAPEKIHFLHWWLGFLTKNSHILGPESNFTPLVVLLLGGGPSRCLTQHPAFTCDASALVTSLPAVGREAFDEYELFEKDFVS